MVISRERMYLEQSGINTKSKIYCRSPSVLFLKEISHHGLVVNGMEDDRSPSVVLGTRTCPMLHQELHKHQMTRVHCIHKQGKVEPASPSHYATHTITVRQWIAV